MNGDVGLGRVPFTFASLIGDTSPAATLRRF
jgi:hypothetical protein